MKALLEDVQCQLRAYQTFPPMKNYWYKRKELQVQQNVREPENVKHEREGLVSNVI